MTHELTPDPLADVPLFAGLRPETRTFLAKRLRHRHLRRGETLVVQGEPAGALYLVTSGRFKVTRTSEDGDETVLGLVGPGACIGEVAVLDGGPRSATVEAVEPAETRVLAREDLLAALREAPELALGLIHTLAGRLRRAEERLESAYFANLETRLARTLLEIAEQHGHTTAAGIETPLPLRQAELASMVGAARPRVNGVLGSFQDAGLIRLGQGSFTILQPDALRRRAGR